MGSWTSHFVICSDSVLDALELEFALALLEFGTGQHHRFTLIPKRLQDTVIVQTCAHTLTFKICFFHPPLACDVTVLPEPCLYLNLSRELVPRTKKYPIT